MSQFEPERLFCTAGECLEEAVVVGHATLQVSTLAGASEDQALHTFDLPLCPHHAHLLRLDNQLVDFDVGTTCGMRRWDEC
jgi:hypothetical protein